MGENGQDKILSFDTLYTNNHIQMLKILSSYLSPGTRKQIAVYIKFLEFQYALSLTRPFASSSEQFSSEKTFNIAGLCEELLPFCGIKEQEILQNIQNFYKNFENMQEMMQMVEMMQEFMPEGFSPGGDMAGMDLSQIFGMMNGDFPTDINI
ncbi:MAG: hypothetical protein IJ833_05745 [Lachnospiraceae bacterium]|nr:hypothetical protein [Lachnospiraceae bacterium]